MDLPEEGVIECYYGFLYDYWGRGFATETATTLIQYCFDNYPVNEIKAYVDPENAGSVSPNPPKDDFGDNP